MVAVGDAFSSVGGGGRALLSGFMNKSASVMGVVFDFFGVVGGTSDVFEVPSFGGLLKVMLLVRPERR
jgi:hypothetical protein